ncbi:MAG: phosphopantothenoylcysteine decarboxylase, partial [Gemmatimonadaceae bacterium]
AGTVESMRDAVREALAEADLLVMAAAPADFRPSTPAAQKIKKRDGAASPVIELTRTHDILESTIHSRRDGCVVVGFALETENLLENSASKLEQKKLDMIVANSAVEEGAGFGGDTNRVIILLKDGTREEVPSMKKTEVADVILDRAGALMNGR